MTLQLEIPESVAASLNLPELEIEPRLRLELALALYAQGILSFGKSAELAELSRYRFAEAVGRRGLPRHYTESELGDDLNYARG